MQAGTSAPAHRNQQPIAKYKDGEHADDEEGRGHVQEHAMRQQPQLQTTFQTQKTTGDSPSETKKKLCKEDQQGMTCELDHQDCDAPPDPIVAGCDRRDTRHCFCNFDENQKECADDEATWCKFVPHEGIQGVSSHPRGSDRLVGVLMHLHPTGGVVRNLNLPGYGIVIWTGTRSREGITVDGSGLLEIDTEESGFLGLFERQFVALEIGTFQLPARMVETEGIDLHNHIGHT